MKRRQGRRKEMKYDKKGKKDIVIIGGGIVGVEKEELIEEEGREVIVIERKGI